MQADDEGSKQDDAGAAPEEAQGPPAAPIPDGGKAPQLRVELGVDEDRDEDAVDGIGDVVCLHCRDGSAGVTVRVLRPHDGGVEQSEVVDSITGHAQDVEEGEVDGEADGCPAADIEDGLGVARRRPAEHVRPPDDARYRLDRVRSHREWPDVSALMESCLTNESIRCVDTCGP